MISSIDKNQFTDELVQYTPNAGGHDYLLIDSEEIVLLKTKGEILINKYLNNPHREEFSFKEIKYSRPFFLEWDSERYNELFDYNKIYLRFEITGGGYRFGKYYFLKENEEVFCICEHLDNEENLTVKELSKNEIEDFFDSNNYDSMYIINCEGYIEFASNKKDGTIINMDIIPSDEEMISIELQKRMNNEFLASIFSYDRDFKQNRLEPKLIDEIQNISIYGKGMFHGYYYILVTSKNGKFDVNWLGLEYIENGKYRLTLENVLITEPTVDYVETYRQMYNISKEDYFINDEFCFDNQSENKVKKR